jgi:hypothetical protein
MVKASLKKSVGDLLLAVVPNGLRDFSKLEDSLQRVRYVVRLGDGVQRMSQGRCAVTHSPYYNAVIHQGGKVEHEFDHVFSDEMSTSIVMFEALEEKLPWKVRLYGWCRTKEPSSQKALNATDLKDFITTPFEPCFTDVYGKMLRCASFYRGKKESKTIEKYVTMFDTAKDIATARMQNAGGSSIANVVKAMPNPPTTLAEAKSNEKVFGSMLKERFQNSKVHDVAPTKGKEKTVGKKNLFVEDKAKESSQRRMKREERSSSKVAKGLDRGNGLDDTDDPDFQVPRKRSRKARKVLDDCESDDEDVVEVVVPKVKTPRKACASEIVGSASKQGKNVGGTEVVVDTGTLVPYPHIEKDKVLSLSAKYPLEVVARQYDNLLSNWQKLFTEQKKFGDIVLAQNPANILLSLSWNGPDDMLKFFVQQVGSGSDVYELYMGLSELANNLLRDVNELLVNYTGQPFILSMEHNLIVKKYLAAFIKGVGVILEVTVPPWKYELDLLSITRDAKRVVYSLGTLQSGTLANKVGMYKTLYKVAFLSKRASGGECYVYFPANGMDDATRACVERISHSYEHCHYWCCGNVRDMERYLRVVESEYQSVSAEFGEVDIGAIQLKRFLGLMDPE